MVLVSVNQRTKAILQFVCTTTTTTRTILGALLCGVWGRWWSGGRIRVGLVWLSWWFCRCGLVEGFARIPVERHGDSPFRIQQHYQAAPSMSSSPSSPNESPLLPPHTNTTGNQHGNPLQFLTEICGVLKRLKRTGWVRQGIPFPESDADHMHRCAMCALMVVPSSVVQYEDEYQLCPHYHPQNIDTNRLLRIALTHDVCEALAGDITPYCAPRQVATKQDVERQAMETIQDMVGTTLGSDLMQWWHEYEQQITPESHYAKDIDKFEMVVQAYEYEKLHLRPNQNSTADRKNGDLSTTTPSPTSNVADSDKDNDYCLQEPLRSFYQTTNSVLKTPLFRRLDNQLRQEREQLLQERGWTVLDNERQQYAARKSSPQQQQPSTTTSVPSTNQTSSSSNKN